MNSTIFTLALSFLFSSCPGQTELERELNITLPDDLKEVWSKQEWNKSNNVFTLYNYKPFYMLDPAEDSIVIKESKWLNALLNSQGAEISKSVVIAKSFLWDEGQFLFYGFTGSGMNKGIWVWHIDKGPQFPSKISNDLAGIFGPISDMAGGFDSSDVVSKLWIKASHGKLSQSDFHYGNFPARDLRDIAEEICPEILYFPNEITLLIDPDKLDEIDQFYSQAGRPGLRSEMQGRHLTELLNQVNMESFNKGKRTKLFVIQFYNSPQYGLCNCTKEQAMALNRYGYFSFYNQEDSVGSSVFFKE